LASASGFCAKDGAMTKAEYHDHHERAARRLRDLAETATTTAPLKARLLSLAEEHDRSARDERASDEALATADEP
jgi:hypothetical protein